MGCIRRRADLDSTGKTSGLIMKREIGETVKKDFVLLNLAWNFLRHRSLCLLQGSLRKILDPGLLVLPCSATTGKGRRAESQKRKEKEKSGKEGWVPGRLGITFPGRFPRLRPLVYCTLAHLGFQHCRHAAEQSHCYGVPVCRSPACGYPVVLCLGIVPCPNALGVLAPHARVCWPYRLLVVGSSSSSCCRRACWLLRLLVARECVGVPRSLAGVGLVVEVLAGDAGGEEGL